MKSSMVTLYDTEEIRKRAKAGLVGRIILSVTYFLLFAVSCAALILYSTILWVFIVSAIFLCSSAVILTRILRTIFLSFYNESVGEIVEVHRESKQVSTFPMGGVNPFGLRKYDNNRKKEIRLTVYIKDGEKIYSYYLRDVSEHQADYYEPRGMAMHIFGTRYPVLLSPSGESWLCPVCGKINDNSLKVCSGCRGRMRK